jgi:hypothetical protein
MYVFELSCVIEIHGTDDNVIMDMRAIYMRADKKGVISVRIPHGKLTPDFICFFRRDFAEKILSFCGTAALDISLFEKLLHRCNELLPKRRRFLRRLRRHRSLLHGCSFLWIMPTRLFCFDLAPQYRKGIVSA